MPPRSRKTAALGIALLVVVALVAAACSSRDGPAWGRSTSHPGSLGVQLRSLIGRYGDQQSVARTGNNERPKTARLDALSLGCAEKRTKIGPSPVAGSPHSATEKS